MSRKVGISAIYKIQQEKEEYKQRGDLLAKRQLEELSHHYEKFRQHLEEFAEKHKKEITANSEFRNQFLQMCTTMGVDPLQSRESIFSKLGLGIFYYVLAVHTIELCMASNDVTGGIMPLDRARLILSRNHQRLTNNDIKTAVEKLSILGSGFYIDKIGNVPCIISVPMEISSDHQDLLNILATNQSVTCEKVQKLTKWTSERVQQRIDFLLNSGMVWWDSHDNSYWTLAFFKSN